MQALTVLLAGFEAGGPNTPSNIDPWFIIGDESNIIVAEWQSARSSSRMLDEAFDT